MQLRLALLHILSFSTLAHAQSLVGDGIADDTAALQALISAGGEVHLKRGTYRITQTLICDLAQSCFTSITGGGVARILNAAAGPAIHVKGTLSSNADPKNIKPSVWEKERMPFLQGLEIMGAHAEADGICATGTMQLTVSQCTVRQCRNGIHLRERNRNILISDCHLYHNTGIGVFYDRVNLHQSNITGSHISYCAGGGIVSRGGEVRNLHIGTCDIEANHAAETAPTANIMLDSTGGSIAEVAITGCTIQHTSKVPNSANIRIHGAGQDASLQRRGGRETTREGNVTITGNVFSDVQFNLDITSSRGVVITGNTFWEGFQYDVRVADSEHVILADNNFDRNPRYLVNGFENAENNGIVLTACQDCSLTGNIISGVQRQRAAVQVSQGYRLRISDNSILDSDGHGLLLEECSQCMVKGNLIRDDRESNHKSKGLSIKVAGGGSNLIEGNLLGAP